MLLSLYAQAQDSFTGGLKPTELNVLDIQTDTLSLSLKSSIQNHDYVKAIIPLIKLIEISLENEDGNRTHYYRFLLAKFYYILGWYSKTIANLEYCQIYYKQNQNNVDYVRTCHFLALVNYRIDNLEMANYFLGQTDLEKPTSNNPLCKYEHLVLEALIKTNSQDSNAIGHISEVLKFSKENSILDLQILSYFALGELQSKLGKTNESCLAYQKCLNLCESMIYLFDMASLNYKIHDCLKKQGLFEDANTRLLNFISINDTLNSIKQNENLLKIDEKYQNKTLREEKIDLAQDKRLFELKSRRSDLTLIGLLFGLVAILFAVFLLVRFYQQKLSASEIILIQNDQINTQKIKELENSITLNNLESMVKGQEEERERIAKDLHDSLGGLLSTIKLRYDKLIFETKNELYSSDFHKVHELIDEACTEVRNIAHDLKPGALEKLGLIDALEDMINRFLRTEQNIIFQHYGLEEANNIDSETSINVYRIIQELVNNSCKHSKAKEILVQLSRNENQLEIIIEDDGLGYDELNIIKGMGLDNIRSRVNYLKGEMSIKSDPGFGTSTYIVIPLS